MGNAKWLVVGASGDFDAGGLVGGAEELGSDREEEAEPEWAAVFGGDGLVAHVADRGFHDLPVVHGRVTGATAMALRTSV